MNTTNKLENKKETKIYKLLSERQLTYRDLAKAVNISYAHAWNIVYGHAYPSVKLAIKIANFLNVKFDEIIEEVS